MRGMKKKLVALMMMFAVTVSLMAGAGRMEVQAAAVPLAVQWAEEYGMTPEQMERGIQLCFNSAEYIKLYPDVKKVYGEDYQKLLKHWLSVGLKLEGRCGGSPVFDPKYYLSANPDIRSAFGKKGYAGAFKHLVLYGIYENRSSSKYYDSGVYRSNYPDLASIEDGYQLAMHYLTAGGVSEQRIANKNGYRLTGYTQNAFVPENWEVYTKGISYPFKSESYRRISSNYGLRVHPVNKTKGLTLHAGVDIPAPMGTPIYATHNGRVVSNDYDSNGGGGWYVTIEDDSGRLRTTYCHAKAQSPLRVGARVTEGETVILYCGTSGASTGPHVHLSTRLLRSNGTWEYVSPVNLLR